VIRTFLAVTVFAICSALTWGLTLRYFASWSHICFQSGMGWDTGLLELLGKAKWDWGLFESSVAPYLPFLFFSGAKQPKLRHYSMIAGMLVALFALLIASGPATSELCDSKGPIPEIGPLFFGVFVSLPAAIILWWLTKSRLPAA
jgi:hypothetical protein